MLWAGEATKSRAEHGAGLPGRLLTPESSRRDRNTRRVGETERQGVTESRGPTHVGLGIGDPTAAW